MRKCAAAGHDPNLAMLVYRAAPLTTSIPSPAELLNERKHRAGTDQIPYPESPLPACPRTDGERQGQNVRALQHDCKGSIFTVTESESLRTTSPPV